MLAVELTCNLFQGWRTFLLPGAKFVLKLLTIVKCCLYDFFAIVFVVCWRWLCIVHSVIISVFFYVLNLCVIFKYCCYMVKKSHCYRSYVHLRKEGQLLHHSTGIITSEHWRLSSHVQTARTIFLLWLKQRLMWMRCHLMSMKTGRICLWESILCSLLCISITLILAWWLQQVMLLLVSLSYIHRRMFLLTPWDS